MILLLSIIPYHSGITQNKIYPCSGIRDGKVHVFNDNQDLKWLPEEDFILINTVTQLTGYIRQALCHCGHYTSTDDIYAVEQGGAFWGDLCESCLNLYPVKESTGMIANWELTKDIPRTLLLDVEFSIGDKVIIKAKNSKFNEHLTEITAIHEATDHLRVYSLANGTVRCSTQLKRIK
jgi:hypothetical protein